MNYQESFSKLMSKYKYAGVNTLLIKNGKTYISSDGYMSLETKEKMTPNTIFRIASVSKVIVALGIMKLYEENKLSITEDISTYLGYTVRNPHFPTIPITLEMLMTQTSSISDGADDQLGYDGVNGPKIYVPLKDLLTNKEYKYYLPKTFRNYLPGTHFEYSNFGCGILACIIEKVSGMYFSDFIREKIFMPLDIDASFRISDIIHTSDVASLYEVENDKFKLIRSYKMFKEYEYPKYPLGDNFRMAAGGLFISMMDLSKIMQMLMHKGTVFGKTIFKKETINFMKEIHWQGESDDPSYYKKGLQLHILDNYGPTIYGHFGSAYGLKSYMYFNDDIGMIFLCNGANFVYNNQIGITYTQDEALKFMISYKEDPNEK